MDFRLLPRGLKLAIDLIRRDFARAWTVDELAAACGVARRTMQTQFRSFVGSTPLEFLRLTRLAEARRQLLRAEACRNGHKHCHQLRLHSPWPVRGMVSRALRRKPFGNSRSDTIAARRGSGISASAVASVGAAVHRGTAF